jgi:hypothetical protein
VRAFVYCRVSTQEQATDDHYSLANQEARCRDYIKHRSWQLVKVLKEVGSGKSAERPNYQELLLAWGSKTDLCGLWEPPTAVGELSASVLTSPSAPRILPACSGISCSSCSRPVRP